MWGDGFGPGHRQGFETRFDPIRRLLLDRPHADDGQTLGRLYEHPAMNRQSVMNYLKQPEDSSPVVPIWRGREKLHYLYPVPPHGIAERRIANFDRGRPLALADLWRKLGGGSDG